ncbi:hypothetical protein D3C81_1079650 [compost metagenome]
MTLFSALTPGKVFVMPLISKIVLLICATWPFAHGKGIATAAPIRVRRYASHRKLMLESQILFGVIAGIDKCLFKVILVNRNRFE